MLLCTRGPVAELLGGAGIGPGALLQAREGLESVLGPESADWKLRLADRGGGEGDLDQLLAICRSADSHAYQLLELAGVNCAGLRRAVIERVQADQTADLRTRSSHIARPAATMSRARRSPRPSPDSTASVRTPRNQRRQSTAGSPRASQSAREVDEPTHTPEVPSPRSTPKASPRSSATASPRSSSTASPRSSATAAALSSAPPSAGPTQPSACNSPPGTLVDPATLPELHGREAELAQLSDALGRRRVRLPILVGPPGSGRTLLAKHLARAYDRPIFHLSATAYDSEEDLSSALAEVEKSSGIAIFDDLDKVPSEVAPPFLGALSHAFSTGQPRVLTLISPEGHGRLAGWLPGALETADVIRVDALTGPPLSAAVKAQASGVLAEHDVELAPDAKLGELTRWADRYLSGIAMPGRALDLLDLACARANRHGMPQVTRALCLEIVSERSGLSPARIESRGDQEILDLEDRLAAQVVGHRKATAAIASLIRRNRAGFGGHRPVVTALLLGPSGVGKTELAKALACALFDNPEALVRLDMSEYAESHAVARIVGAPPGYVGHEQGGALSDPLLRRPHCVVLLDEIEKAHRDVHQLLLQVFDDGRLTDGRGRTVDFRHAAIIMTSNLGADQIRIARNGPRMPEAEVLDAARSAFPVELWNRIEAPLVMQPLSREQMAKICHRLAQSSSQRLLKERGIQYALDASATNHLVALAGRDPSLGARPLRHLLVREVEALVADAILRGQVRAGDTVEVGLNRGHLTLRERRSPVIVR